ncbi:glycosyltransferase family 4 protein [Pontibacter sp. BT310]|uniref:Glycosyltransferase family 4 protein n=1 Tax=Pontibacter populi TaxID=890055 RepID=A0ABS6XFE9_9BACT|nr:MULTISPECIES: glycosyltransferase family 4 protein [Pontibacter]MBJ6119850.1 glycosyltransferase family 4 protein [Pontibacter sp. BT310]MBR0572279.1 glycosyltransferase family 4 protein [Microvirga sp. STS03]MBW3366703.1 glycosyltransferase family 4 protein [Pontibacter populi]
MHVTILHQHHASPDCPATCRQYSFMEKLARRHKITLVATNAWRKLLVTQNYSWVPEGVELKECTVAYANKMGVVLRMLSFVGFAACAFYKLMRLKKPDILWAVSVPLSVPFVVAQVARLRNVPWVFEVQDLWPSFPVEMGAVKYKWMQRLLFKMEYSLYKSAAYIITLSPDMTAYVVAKGIDPAKVTTILNGTDIEKAEAVTEADVEEHRANYKLQGKQVVLYAGTYGRANDMPTIMQAVELLANDPAIVFILTGTGYYESQLHELAQRVPNLLLLPPQSRDQVFGLFKLADLSLVTFNDLPVLQSNSPAKFYDSLACGTPVIVTNPGWTKAFVENYSCGWYSPAEEPTKLAQTIKQVLDNPEALQKAGCNGVTIARELFDRRELVKEVEAILENVAKR